MMKRRQSVTSVSRKYIARRAGLRLVILTLALVFFCAPFVAHALQAGAAKVDITPALGTPLNGYGYRLGRGATEVHDTLWARCLYLESGETRVFLITSDLCIINRELRDRVLELAPEAVPAQNIIMTATHTHNGPGGMTRALWTRSVSGRFMPDLLESTAQKFAEAMRLAYAARRRGAIGYGTAEQLVLSKNRSHDGGPIDTQIGVIRVDDSDGTPMAILANLAAHPTTIGKEFGLAFSADYPGYFYEALEELSAPGCIAMFMNGAEGNQTCANPEGKSGFARTESIGRLLAIRAKEIANQIQGAELSVVLHSSTPQLPPTLAERLLPRTTVLKTLEIGGLILTFFPGEPAVEIGLEMRRQSLDRGYDAQFTVGLSNDHLMYFVPPEFYSHDHYEAGMNFYGPSIADWFYTEFGKLMSKNKSTEETAEPPLPEIVSIGGAPASTFQGTAREIGMQRGRLFRDDIRKVYESRVHGPVLDGVLLPKDSLWSGLPSFIDTAPVALPILGIGARQILAGLSGSVRDEILGISEGAGLAFDAVWLAQIAPVYFQDDHLTKLFETPFCTMFAAVGDRAGADGLLVGRSLDWDTAEPPATIHVRPSSGRHYLDVGFTWSAGVFTGMNDRGVVICAERMPALGFPEFGAPPIEFVIRDVLAKVETLDAAVASFAAVEGLRGYHVLIADPAGPAAVVMELGDELRVRHPQNGLLLGADPTGAQVDAAARSRYARVSQLLADERIIAPSEMQDVLADIEPGKSGRETILNEFTRHCVIFQPIARKARIAFPGSTGVLGEFETTEIRRVAP